MGEASLGSLLPFSRRKEKTSGPQEITQVLDNPSGMSENTSNKSISPQNNVKRQQMFFPPLACSKTHVLPRRSHLFSLIKVGVQIQSHTHEETERKRCIRNEKLCLYSSCWGEKKTHLPEYVTIMEKYRPLNIPFQQT